MIKYLVDGSNLWDYWKEVKEELLPSGKTLLAGIGTEEKPFYTICLNASRDRAFPWLSLECEEGALETESFCRDDAEEQMEQMILMAEMYLEEQLVEMEREEEGELCR